MKHLMLIGAVVAITTPAMAGDVGLTVSINQPGLYGQITIGDVQGPPQLIYARPVVILRGPEYASQPIYLHVPPGHEKHWSKHCAQYRACGRPVYFVRDDWYNREYAPRHKHRERGKDHGHEHGHDDKD